MNYLEQLTHLIRSNPPCTDTLEEARTRTFWALGLEDEALEREVEEEIERARASVTQRQRASPPPPFGSFPTDAAGG